MAVNQFQKRRHDRAVRASTKAATKAELAKTPARFEILNYLARQLQARSYLEIGVRDPRDNFERIEIATKYSVDPGVEFKANPVDFQMTSDEFFRRLDEGDLERKPEGPFDLIFIDGLHLADQVRRDIGNAMNWIRDDGLVVLHDCNPPTEWHARESYDYKTGPARGCWSGTTWKAFVAARARYDSCCIDTDWGVGILSKISRPGFTRLTNAQLQRIQYFDFSTYAEDRQTFANLITFETLRRSFDGHADPGAGAVSTVTQRRREQHRE